MNSRFCEDQTGSSALRPDLPPTPQIIKTQPTDPEKSHEAHRGSSSRTDPVHFKALPPNQNRIPVVSVLHAGIGKAHKPAAMARAKAQMHPQRLPTNNHKYLHSLCSRDSGSLPRSPRRNPRGQRCPGFDAPVEGRDMVEGLRGGNRIGSDTGSRDSAAAPPYLGVAPTRTEYTTKLS